MTKKKSCWPETDYPIRRLNDLFLLARLLRR
jgi:hypothetical protein